MECITVRLPEEMINALDKLILKGLYPNRSEIIRDALRLLLRQYAPKLEEKLNTILGLGEP